ncbi:MAG: carotenoid biosynthesis protein [Syntrophales bacterium]|nr:carotenoid biosynthesis protein [Syntrophales bacterium]
MIHPEVSKFREIGAGDRRFMYRIYMILFLVIALSTYLHHAYPSILSVPSNRDVTTWKNPTFEQTMLYERMTEVERQKVRSEGVPDGGSLSVQFAVDLFMVLVSWFCYRHARDNHGFWMASCFFIGSFIFTGLEESLWILSGRYLGGLTYLPPGGVLFGTYWFTKGGFWFIETPLVACLGWFAIAYSCVWVAGKVFPRRGYWGRAAVGGLIAMGLDLWGDPVATSPELMNWVWAKGDFFLLFGIPSYNFIAWFLIIFVFAVFWEKLPEMERKWGPRKAWWRFFALCTTSTLFLAVFIYFSWFVLASRLFLLTSAASPLIIPLGW